MAEKKVKEKNIVMHVKKEKSKMCNAKDKVCKWFKESAFRESFKTFDPKLLISSLFDLAFIVLIYLSTIFIVVVLGKNDFSVLNQLQLDPENLLLLSQTTGLIVRVVMLSLLLAILYLAFFSATRVFVFSYLLEKKRKFSQFLISLGVTSTIAVIFIFLMSIISKVVVAEYMGYVGLIVILTSVYYLTTYNSVFFILGKFKGSIKKTNFLAFSRFYKTIPVMLLAVVTYSIVYNLIKWFFQLIYINENEITYRLISIILMFIFLIGVTWMRYYISIYVHRNIKHI
jgi:hypothetical protein